MASQGAERSCRRRLSVSAGEALDAACFHAQQVAEKCIKAYLTAHEIGFHFIHNLEKLIEVCAQRDPSSMAIKTLGQELTPYAVELCYDDEFWPSAETSRHSLMPCCRLTPIRAISERSI